MTLSQRIAQLTGPDRSVDAEVAVALGLVPTGYNRFTDIPKVKRQAKADANRRQKARARALLLVIKAKLESVESGVKTFDEAFLPNIVMSDGLTVWVASGNRWRWNTRAAHPSRFCWKGRAHD